MRLCIAPGPNTLKGWTNLDLARNGDIVESYKEPIKGLDVEGCDAKNMPFADESVDEVFASHFIEHIPPEETQTYLKEMRRVLKKRGKLTLVVPDLRKVARAYMEGKIDADRFLYEFILGMGDPDDIKDHAINKPPHQRAFDQEGLFNEILKAGFYGITPINVVEHPLLNSRVGVQAGYSAFKPDQEAEV